MDGENGKLISVGNIVSNSACPPLSVPEGAPPHHPVWLPGTMPGRYVLVRLLLRPGRVESILEKFYVFTV